ncbi:MAG TPA: TlpA disulfide reductase family protein [Candidatus Sulfopaludibacter sp.]|nr:TlpA disulfide reductase family protein [Candidatus Sulfopaludibacter sp.]
MRNAVAVFLACALAPLLTAADAARPSPPFSILRPGAAPLELSQFRGKVVALAFIDTHCPHCQKLTNFLDELAPKYAERGAQVLECAFNDDARDSLAEFKTQFHPPFPVGYSNRAAVMAYLQISILDPHPLYVPHMVFLDRRGTIRADIAGESDFMKQPEVNIPAELEKLLKAPPGARTANRGAAHP